MNFHFMPYEHLTMYIEEFHGCTSDVTYMGRGILRVASCEFELRVRVASSSCEFELRVASGNVQVASFGLRVQYTHTLRVEQCELRVSHICELNDFGFQCDLSACVCLR